MNPYERPNAPLTNEANRPGESWLSPHLRRAFMIPPLVAVPTLAIALRVLDSTTAPLPWALWVGITAAAYVLQFTYGALCYFVLTRLRKLRLSTIVVASQLPSLPGFLAFDLPTVVAYSIAALAMGLASAYFLAHPSRRSAP